MQLLKGGRKKLKSGGNRKVLSFLRSFSEKGKSLARKKKRKWEFSLEWEIRVSKGQFSSLLTKRTG